MLWEQCFFLRFTLVLFFVFASCLWILFAFDPFPFFLDVSGGRSALLMIPSSLGLVAVASGMLGVRFRAYLVTFLSGCLFFVAAYLFIGQRSSLPNLFHLQFWGKVYWILLSGSGLGLFAMTVLLIKAAGKMS